MLFRQSIPTGTAAGALATRDKQYIYIYMYMHTIYIYIHMIKVDTCSLAYGSFKDYIGYRHNGKENGDYFGFRVQGHYPNHVDTNGIEKPLPTMMFNAYCLGVTVDPGRHCRLGKPTRQQSYIPWESYIDCNQ